MEEKKSEEKRRDDKRRERKRREEKRKNDNRFLVTILKLSLLSSILQLS